MAKQEDLRFPEECHFCTQSNGSCEPVQPVWKSCRSELIPGLASEQAAEMGSVWFVLFLLKIRGS